MKINRHNYEVFLLDHLEGRLSVEEQQELEKFLLLNPDCTSELSEKDLWILEGGELSFSYPETLKKYFPDHSTVLKDHNFDMFSIARMEGDLENEQVRAHRAMLDADRRKSEQWRQWQLTRLVAEPLLFEGKEGLKHRKTHPTRRILISVFSAAAALALLFMIFRAEPDLRLQESIIQNPQESIMDQIQDVPLKLENNHAETEPVVNQDFPEKGKMADQLNKSPLRVPDNIEAASSSNVQAIKETLPLEDIKPESRAISASHFHRSSLVREATPDQIQALQISPVPVHIRSMTLAQLTEFGLQKMVEDYVEEKDISLWKIASAGIRGINRLTGADISLMASRDEADEISGFQLKSRHFSVTGPIGQDE